MLIPEEAEPNVIHHATKRLQKDGKLLGVITQNIDGLYEKAGLSEDVLEIHGNGRRFICSKCKKSTEAPKSFLKEHYTSSCCNKKIRPDIVLYDEMFKEAEVQIMNHWFQEADLLIVMGTELNIYPHFENVRRFKGNKLLISYSLPASPIPWTDTFLQPVEEVFN